MASASSDSGDHRIHAANALEEVRGKPIISYCLNTFAECARIDGIQIVADVGWREFIQAKMCGEKDYRIKFKGFSKPGENRQISILHGLEDNALYAGNYAR